MGTLIPRSSRASTLRCGRRTARCVRRRACTCHPAAHSRAQIWIKDVKSSNGTYINTQRLAPEGVESEPFELHSGDILVRTACRTRSALTHAQELGTDIASEDNTKIVHHKVAARVTCIVTAEDAAALAASRQQQDPQASQFAFGQGGPQATRRPMNQMGMAMGGMGGSTRAPGTRSGLSFDHIMSKIQSELQKSRETGAELHGLSTTMNDIQDTLGGTLVRLCARGDIVRDRLLTRRS